MQDVIKREVTVKATKERVYAAIADPKQIVSWFPDAVEGSFEVGERPIFEFAGYGKSQVYIAAAQPHEYFAFRWVPGSAHAVGDVLAVPNTLVEFRLSEANGQTTVTMTESGFASLPPETMAEQLKDNTGGWDYMMDRLEKKFASQS